MSIINQSVEVSPPLEDTAPTVTPPKVINGMLPSTIEVIGSDAVGKTFIWVRDKRILREFSLLRSIDKRVIQQLAGYEAVIKFMRDVRKAYGDDAEAYDVAKTTIACQSRDNIFTNDTRIGQGIYVVKGECVLVSGQRAYVLRHHESEEIFTLHPVEHPIFKETLVEFDLSNQWIDPETLLSDLQQTNSEIGSDLIQKLGEHLSCWKFQQPVDRHLAIGMILATPIQHYLPFRSHVWLSGPTNCGKSAFKDFLKRMWPYAHEIQNKTTLAGLRNTIASSSLPLLLDECEKSRHRDDILHMLRSATRKGEMRIGTASGGTISFSLHHIAWIMSIQVGLVEAADINRFIVIQLEPPEKIAMPPAFELNRLGEQITATSFKLAAEISRLWYVLYQVEDLRSYGRLLDVHSLPVAALSAYQGLTDEEAIENLRGILSTRGPALKEEERPDHADILELILSFPMEARLECDWAVKNSASKYPVGEIIRRVQKGEIPPVELDPYGIKIIGKSHVFFATNVVQRRLLAGTKWRDGNISDILLRIGKGTRRTAQRVAGVGSVRGVLIPFEQLPLGYDQPDLLEEKR